MILRHFLHTEPAVAISYLFGCGGKGIGAVVDPVAEAAFYQDEARTLGLSIRYVVDTHVHADHRSSARALAHATGAEYLVHALAASERERPSTSVRGVQDGDVLTLGNVIVTVWHVPGHTPEHLALLVTDRRRGEAPWLVFTGHTLMVGDMGRTELATDAATGARALFTSAERLRTLPDYVQVLPGAFSGSVCGRGLSGNPFSTVGFERRFNRAFQVTDADAFTALMLEEIPPAPPGAADIRAENMRALSEAILPSVARMADAR